MWGIANKEILHERNSLRSSYSIYNPLPPPEGLFFPTPYLRKPYFSAGNQRDTKPWWVPALCTACCQLLPQSSHNLFFIIGLLIPDTGDKTNISHSSKVWAPWERSLCPSHILFIFIPRAVSALQWVFKKYVWMNWLPKASLYFIPSHSFRDPGQDCWWKQQICCLPLPPFFQD